ncbi:MAG: c-type cytochrome [Gammaproteobacteria bacterium]
MRRRILTFASASAICSLLSSVPTHLAAQETGEERYVASGCAVCHGAAGQGNELGPRLADSGQSVEAFVNYVRNPVWTMVAYPEDAISDDDLDAVHGWLASVEAPRLPVGNAERGATLYQRNGCYQCHANEGQGGAQGPRLGPNPITLTRFTWYSRHPGRGMPPYAEAVMSDQDFADVHAFLAARPLPPPLEDLPELQP